MNLNRIISAFLLLCMATSAMAQQSDAADTVKVRKARYQKLVRMPEGAVFVPKGQLMVGGTIGASSEKLTDASLLIIQNVNANGYNFSAAPYFAGFVADNFCVGTKFRYNRMMLDLGSIDLNLTDDMNFGLKDFYFINHKYEGQVFARYYLAIANSKMFGMFAEGRLTYAYSEGKNTIGTGADMSGTYQMKHSVGFSVNPGLCVFLTNNAAFEVSLGILGVDYSWKRQITNQIDNGYITSGGANFKLNFLSINLGVSVFF